jgi:cell wall-associated NlpC family hydrolase
MGMALRDYSGGLRRLTAWAEWPIIPRGIMRGGRDMGTVLFAAWLAVLAIDAPAAQAVAAVEQARAEAVVLGAVENMYSGPDPARDVVSQALLGQVVAIVETRDSFARIETPDRYRGWIPLAALSLYADPKAPRYGRHGAVAEVTSLMAQVYRDPDVTSARPKAQAPLGVRLEALPDAPLPGKADAARWLTVRLPSGETAFVQRGDVSVVDAAAPVAPGNGTDLVATARRFMGAPYVWGGMSPQGVDCSGLVSRVFWSNGIEVQRDADIQFSDPRAAPVDRAALQPGDLLFFGTKKITHVGIYAGEGRFIHATSYLRPMVQESALDDPHWTSLFRGARRMPAVAAR